MGGLGWVGDGPDVVGNAWDVRVKGLVLLIFWALLKGWCYCCYYFSSTFSGFAIVRSKKYIKVIEQSIKIDAVDP